MPYKMTDAKLGGESAKDPFRQIIGPWTDVCKPPQFCQTNTLTERYSMRVEAVMNPWS